MKVVSTPKKRSRLLVFNIVAAQSSDKMRKRETQRRKEVEEKWPQEAREQLNVRGK